jgi:F0F1-type ATP synthase assembly protein I
MYNDLSERIAKAVMTLIAIAIVFGIVVGGLIGYVIN